MAEKKERSIVRTVLLGTAALLALVVVFYATIGAAENGVFGARLQAWTRIEKARFTFNRVYSMATPPFEQNASAFLVRCVEGVPSGTALDIAAGQGRNAVYLAKRGWRVTAFDISDAGMKAAAGNALRAGARLVTVRSSAQQFDYGRAKWDLVLLSYAPIPYDDAGLMARIRESVAPGGTVVIDNPVLMHRPSGAGPRVPGDLEPGELPKLFPGFDIIDYTEGEATTDWFHLKMPVGRLLAKKKP